MKTTRATRFKARASYKNSTRKPKAKANHKTRDRKDTDWIINQSEGQDQKRPISEKPQLKHKGGAKAQGGTVKIRPRDSNPRVRPQDTTTHKNDRPKTMASTERESRARHKPRPASLPGPRPRSENNQ